MDEHVWASGAAERRAMSISTTFALVWVAFTAATVLAVIPIAIWAIRSRQFSDQDHARYLPLRSAWPEDGDAETRTSRSGHDA